MIHIAMMKRSWGMIPKILSGQKTIESRWYKTKRAPWDKIRIGEEIYFKNSGEPVTAKATVAKVFQFSELTPKKVRGILERFGPEIGVEKNFYKLVRDKKYCLLIFLSTSRRVKPFSVKKTGFGAMSSWISVKSLRLVNVPEKS